MNRLFLQAALFASLSFSNCIRKSVGPETDIRAETPAPTTSYLALGDSYTIGESVSEEERYPNLLAAELRKKYNKSITPRIIARTGWTTGNLQEAIYQTNFPSDGYDLVSLLIGVNNQYQGRSPREYKTEFIRLVQVSVQLAKGKKERVCILSIPDYGFTPFGKNSQKRISAELNIFNAINKQVADSLNIIYFDITPISQSGLERPELVATDGLHPSGKMYSEWVHGMTDKVYQMLLTQ